MTRGVSARSSILNYTTPVQVAAPALGGKGGARRDIACRRSSRRRRGRTVAGRLRIAYCVQCYAPASGEGRGEQSWQVEDAVCSGWQKWRGLKRMDVAAIAWLTLASALKSASMALCCLREVSSVERCCAISSPRSFIDMATSCLCQARESAQLSPRSRAAKFRSTLEYRNHDPEYPVSAATAARTAVAAASDAAMLFTCHDHGRRSPRPSQASASCCTIPPRGTGRHCRHASWGTHMPRPLKPRMPGASHGQASRSWRNSNT